MPDVEHALFNVQHLRELQVLVEIEKEDLAPQYKSGCARAAISGVRPASASKFGLEA